MNVITRGMRNAYRSPLRSAAIVAMLAISIGLILAMLVARASVDAKIAEVKASTATQITINPAGVRGGMGGGDPLTAEQLKAIQSTAHVKSTTAALMEQLDTDSTNLTPSLELGKRMIMRAGGQTHAVNDVANDDTEAPAPPISLTGTDSPQSTIISGKTIDGNSNKLEALIGKSLAEKNNLKIGDTFTIYDKTITIKGIFSNENAFEDSGIVMSLSAVQSLTDQAGAVSTVTATVDSSDTVASTVTALKNSLGDKADVTSQQEQAENSLEPLKSIANLALAGVIGASVAGAAIVLLSMIMIVRERRREIGVIKAIGGTNAKVITQFISEALTLTIIGGAIGIGLGIAVSGPMTQSLVSNSQNTTKPAGLQRAGGGPVMIHESGLGQQIKTTITSVTSTLTPEIVAGSVGIVLLIAIVGSAVPAWAIARVRPAEVLRTE